jgi:phage recombination protein Bet
MTNDIVETKESKVSIWDQETELHEIKKMCGSNLSEGEFMLFVQMGKALDLNPFLKQIWAVKYGSSPAQIFIGRDGYLVNAMRHPQYNGIECNAYYSNDKIIKDSVGNITHEINYTARGRLLGAYAILHRKDLAFPIMKDVLLSEYSTGKSLWNSKPETMIKKVAEAQALRFAFPEMFQGTYSESEQWESRDTKKTSSLKPFKIGKPKPIIKEEVKEDPNPQEVEYTYVEETPKPDSKTGKILDIVNHLNQEAEEIFYDQVEQRTGSRKLEEKTELTILQDLYRFAAGLLKEQESE